MTHFSGIPDSSSPHASLGLLPFRTVVSHSSGLGKTILQGTVKEGRRRGRQKKSWEDNVREWTGLEFAMSQRAVENREKWRKLVVKLSVVPQQLSMMMMITAVPVFESKSVLVTCCQRDIKEI